MRLTERFLPSDPPTRASSSVRAEHVRAQLPELEVGDAVGVAGTITSLAALDLGLVEYDRERVHGHVHPARRRSSASSARLAALPLAERRRCPPSSPSARR